MVKKAYHIAKKHNTWSCGTEKVKWMGQSTEVGQLQ